MVRRSLLLFSAVLMACSTVNETQQPVVEGRVAAIRFIQPLFSALDCEGVGEIDPGEVDEHFFELYFFADRDHSRTISEQEYVQSISQSNPELDSHIFHLMDKDGDSVVTTSEFRSYLFRAMHLADRDRNGTVSEQEAEIHDFRRAPLLP